MYLPRAYRQEDLAELHAAIVATRLGTFVTVSDGTPLVSHVPMLLDPARGPYGTLRFHLARANPQAKALRGGQSGLAIFLGPSAYVSPSLYESAREHGKVVPTADYLAVHASGPVTVARDRSELHALVDDLTNFHETPRAEPWRVADAPADYIARQLGAIVGVELHVATLEGKWKLDQDVSSADRASVACALEASADPADRAVAAAIRRTKP